MRVSVLMTLSFLAGCNVDIGGSETAGELGRVSFAYETGTGCFLGCSLATPMLRGTRELLSASGPLALSGATLSVEPAGVVQIGEVDSRPDGEGHQVSGFELSAIGVGEARLSLTDAQGALIDRVTVSVHDAARVSAEWALVVPDAQLGSTTKSWSSSSAVQLSRSHGVVDLSAFDASGQRLQAERGFAVALANPALVKITSLQSDNHLLELEPSATGTTTLTAGTQTGVSTQLVITTQAP